MTEKGTSVTLDLYFTGLCLFVPNRKKGYVSVLMPKSEGFDCDHERIHAHRAEIVYGRQFSNPDCGTDTVPWCVEDLSGMRLVFNDGSGPLEFDLPGVYRLNRDGNRKARNDVGPHNGLLAEVRLGCGRCVHVPRGARLFVDGRMAEMPSSVHWVVRGVEPILRLEPLGPGVGRQVQLHPGRDQRIALYFRNVPHKEPLPDAPAVGPPAKNAVVHHFAAFNQLLASGKVDEPVWRGEPEDHPPPVELFSAASPRAHLGGDPYTCMPGQTDPDGP